MKTYKLGNKINKLTSFQAEFFEDAFDPSFILKVYYDDRNVYGLINLKSPKERERIIKREFELNKNLAPQLECKIVITEGEDHHLKTALRMKRLGKDSFLKENILQNHKLGKDDLKHLANLITNFHSSKYSKVSKIKNPSGYYLLPIIKNDLNAIVELNKNFKGFCNKVEKVITKFLNENKKQLLFRQQVLNEPHNVHGDIKIANIAFFGRKPLILDPAPLEKWQILDRRLDAIMLKIDLEIMNLFDEARIYWKSYTDQMQKFYLAKYKLFDKNLLEESDRVVDTIGYIYFLIVLLKVSLKEKDEDRTHKVFRMLKSCLRYI